MAGLVKLYTFSAGNGQILFPNCRIIGRSSAGVLEWCDQLKNESVPVELRGLHGR